MSCESRRTVAIAWYHRQDYDLIRHAMDDGDVLPEDYDTWLRRVEAIVRIETSRGSVVLKALILPGPFVAWCRATNQRPDVAARTGHVNLALEDYCSGYSSLAILHAYEPA